VFHLLLAHHGDDQRETVALRVARGSGPAGRAGMSAISDIGGVRLLRPLLGWTHRELLDICRVRGLAWIEDPSNADPRFARARLRAGTAAPPADPHAAIRRETDEAALAGLAARAAAIAPGGFVWLDRAALHAAPEPLAVQLLARAVMCVGGDVYAPSPGAAHAAWAAVRDAAPGTRGRTLGHCRVRVEADSRVLVAREVRACAAALELTPGTGQIWDGRFAVAARGSAFGLEIGALGAAGWASLPREVREAAAKSVPAAARASLPAVRDLDGVLFVPHLFYGRTGHSLDTVDVLFRPRHRLTGPAFVAVRPAL
jgi:tRNA(Ile)-lysidine synthase